ncbi:MAG: hypothetical protein H8E71_00395 [Candidatus Marinimicrobia bacterium]|nr:hypothetical protein [Candidatus Neomarinimicrobiota bacterium]
MSWINSLLNNNKSKTIQVELLGETEKSIKVKYGIYTTQLKKLISYDRPNEGNKVQVRLPMWLYRESFI